MGSSDRGSSNGKRERRKRTGAQDPQRHVPQVLLVQTCSRFAQLRRADPMPSTAGMRAKGWEKGVMGGPIGGRERESLEAEQFCRRLCALF
eukprot:TRINITY_DN27360_c0_g1_i1.p1 TRINITY_DN27360_c0_g1~~TRINITY_DN27360_c0_g1_i1.p1  ORF type:complete len:105 (-),score=9.11 TRINITY_DN27360_c0_g1_i1:44-316(-)